MTTFSIDIEDESGIEFVRGRYNEANPQNIQEANEDYYNLMVTSLFEQWSQSKKDDNLQVALAALDAGDSAPILALVDVQAQKAREE